MERLAEIFSRRNVKRVLQYGLFMIVTLIVQNMLCSGLRIFGVCPMFLPAAVIAVGMFEGATAGALFAVLMGIFADMSFVENVVFFTLLLPALAFAAGFIAQFYINRRFFAYMLMAVAGCLLTAVAQMLKTTAEDVFAPVMLATAALQTLWSIPFAIPVYFPPARWIE